MKKRGKSRKGERIGMDWMYLVYFFLGLLLFFGARGVPKGAWNEEFTSLKQTKALLGIMALGVAFHHLAQKTCAPWLPYRYIVKGLDFFLPLGYLFVAVFLFCSGLGLYKSLHTKPDYLKFFFRRRVLPVIAAFYLSEWIFTAVRLLTGEKMDAVKILWNLSGLHMANEYSWYVIVIPFFYLVFWAAFRSCRREGTAVFWVFLFTLAYTVLGALIDHQSDWWMRGEWWYNSIILFPLGLLFAKYEQPVVRFIKKGYWFWLLFFAVAAFLLFFLSDDLVSFRWGYYGEHGAALKVPHRLMSAGIQWLSCTAFVAFLFLLLMKVKLGNKALAWIGGMSLEFYLMHGLFVQLFGYQFLDSPRSLYYIRNVPLYTLAVLACSVPASWLFGVLRKSLLGTLPEKRAVKERWRSVSGALRKAGRFFFPVLFVLVAIGFFLLSPKDGKRIVGGVVISPPAGYTQRFADSRYVTWEYSGSGKTPGWLTLDTDIRGDYNQNFASAEDVLEECGWLEDGELYVNPQGIRIVRGFSREADGAPMRRYYVECDASMFLLSMIEDSRYYDPADCEAAMQETADNLRHR